MGKVEEKLYIEGEARSLNSIILYCQSRLKTLGIKLKSKEEFSTERIDTIKTLRSLCEDYGDNDWPDNLHLTDVIEMHLMRHLDL